MGLFKHFTLPITAAFLAWTTPHVATAETLAQALTAAYNHSGLVRQNRALLRAADEDVASAVAALRPIVSWSGDITRSSYRSRTASSDDFTTSASTSAAINLIVQFTLFDGGLNRNTIEAAKETVLATRADLSSVEQQVLFRAVSAFFEVKRSTQTVALRRNNVRVIGQELRAARDRFELGETTRTDVSLAEARLSAAQSELAAALGQQKVDEEEYRAVIGHRPSGLVYPNSLPTLPASTAAGERKAVSQHPAITSLQHQITASEIAVRIAENAKLPNVDLTGSYGVDETFKADTSTRGGSISIDLSGPIYAGGALSSAERQARANRDATRFALHDLTHDVQQAVANAYAQLAVAQSSRQASESQVRASSLAFDGVREEATLGSRTTLDVLDAEQELLDARAALISAQVDESVAAYQVLYTVGDLTATKLALNVPHYDPADYYNLVKNAPAAVSKQGRELDRVLRALGKE